MDSPEIRYCRTEDGINIAYATSGSGPPLVRVIGWFTHLEVEWQLPEARALWERFAQNHLLVRYDGRGMGLSDPVEEFSPATRLADLEAVVEAAGLERFALLGISEGAHQAIAYASKHPERVTHLILYGPAVAPDEDASRSMARTWQTWHFMISEGWDKPSATYHDFMPKLFLGSNATPERIRWFTELTRASAPGARAAKYFRRIEQPRELLDAAEALTVPTLIVQRRGDNLIPVDWSRRLAALIPGARLLLQEGDDHTLVMGGPGAEDFVEAVERFLGAKDSMDAPAHSMPKRPETRDDGAGIRTQRGGHGYAFVSYASADRPRVEAIVKQLTDAGVNVWMDRVDLRAGSNWAAEIVQSIRGCSALLVVCSPAAFESRNVRQEIQVAGKYNRPYIPLILEAAEFPAEVEYQLEGWQWVSIQDQQTAEWLPKVLTALQRFQVVPRDSEGRVQ